MHSQPRPELRARLQQIEEQLHLAIQDFPERIAVERLKFVLALAKFVRHRIDLDATVEQTSPEAASLRQRAPQ